MDDEAGPKPGKVKPEGSGGNENPEGKDGMPVGNEKGRPDGNTPVGNVKPGGNDGIIGGFM